jgi:hypothetical protein
LYGGSFIGIGVNLSGTLATGTLNFYPTVNGVPVTLATGDSPEIILSELTAYETFNARDYAFSAGDTIGLMYTKADTVDPTTRDIKATVYVLFEGVNL